jgi:hypothetical protein
MKLIIANSLVGIALMVLGYSSGGLGLIAAWLGIGFVLTGLGYAGMGARVYGKNASGQFPAWAIMLYLPFFIYTECIWRLVQPLIRERAYDWVTDTIIIGRRLCTRSFPDSVKNYVDLTAEFYEPKAVIENLTYVSLPILDGNIPEIQKLNRALDQLSDDITYIHCGQGHGRTGLFTVLLLARRGLVSTPEEAMALLKSKRPKLALTKKQKEFVRKIMK